ncbi:MarC family protein [Haoranjiania flava]|uniref:UPF0056 membrane protein n=1 Tax=Haoranjiania flava TaxID=1856322 RepID=A0AAE3IMP1_9BACT|nr:MarC family protein [Haoranjiania flava]MCU7694885.1 MarC family protein [Haoranjiania flava]
MNFTLGNMLSISFTLFAVIDAMGSIPLFISIKRKSGGELDVKRIIFFSGLIMIAFLFLGSQILKMLGVDVKSFAVAGSIVLFLFGFEMISGHEVFKGDGDKRLGAIVPIAFPLIAGSATLTTIISFKAIYSELEILGGILINLIFAYLVLTSLKWFEKMLGPGGINAVRKFFGVILIAIAVKMFGENIDVFSASFNK